MPISQITTNSIASNTITSGILATGQTLSVNGITFPATQVSSAGANTLDDYEEGTWTPTVTPSSGSLTSYTSSGIYVKIGRFVQVVGVFTLTTPGTASGYGFFGGLPFTAVGPSTAYRPALGTGREDAQTGVFYQVQVGPGSGVWRISTAADGPITWGTNYEYVFTMTFQTA
jgi:hypothetical protein